MDYEGHDLTLALHGRFFWLGVLLKFGSIASLGLFFCIVFFVFFLIKFVWVG